ncbi:hypothetical protein [Corynebacterium sp. HMSC071B10]|uniref:hypothetical protein n=1 Tax=Corynebacterium sp. HMSC071B10 TaxID=1739494 RepID=UPI0008A23964|nr:hypothetical protein [Corynebacterium sp. HMSC071B10]OFP36350.1 hypothetical protein HMPREF2990_06710 [Corynebacterium sp. HMSC071B10]
MLAESAVFGIFAVVSLVMLLASSVLGPAGWAVVLLLGHPLLALALAAWDTVRAEKVNWLWCVVPPVVQALEILVIMNPTALPFVALVVLGGALGLGLGYVILRGKRR